MKRFVLAALAVSAIVFAAPQYPFPQNKQYAYGQIFNPDLKKTESSIRQKFESWKKQYVVTDYEVNGVKTAYVTANQAKFQIYARDIANSMLLTVYMASSSDDTQELFDQFLNFYRCFPAKGQSNLGCDSKYNIDLMSGEVLKDSSEKYTLTLAFPDADFDAALALLLADKQWGSEGTMNYASLARSLVNKIMESDIVEDSLRIKSYSDYNPAFNPSYTALANFQAFDDNVINEFTSNNWGKLIPAVTEEIFLCQDTSTGLVPAWCDWKTHTPCNVEQHEEAAGFNYDALRTPWRMAQAYYWYGNKDAKKFNDRIAKWLPYTTYEHASYIRNNYNLDGTHTLVEVLSPYGDAAEIGGVGLAMTSADDSKFYLETVYESLLNLSTRTLSHATESLLQLLLLTGNMPNLLKMDGTTDIKKVNSMRQPQMPKGMLDSSLKISGFGNWTIKSNGFNKITVFPDSTKKPLFADDGKALAKAEMRVESSVGTKCSGAVCDDLENVFVGLALYFDSNYQDLSDVDTIRMTLKTQGVIGVSALSYGKDEKEERITYWDKNLIHPSEDFTTISFAINFADFNKESMGKVKGLAFEPLMTPGGYASIEIQDIRFLDKDGKLVKFYDELGIDTTQQPVMLATLKTSKPAIHVAGRTISIQNSKVAKAQLFDMQGSLILEKTILPNGSINAPRAGSYILRLNGQAIPVKIRE